MASIDTVLAQVTNETTLTGVTVANGDSLTVRSFSPPAQAFLDDVVIKGGQVSEAQLTSPYLADTTRGITFLTAQAPSTRLIPRYAAQPLSSQDTLKLTATSGAANSTLVALLNYYTDLGASDARLYNPGDVLGLITQIKPLEVDTTTSATIGEWVDTAITTTEDLLAANRDYAVLGYVADVAVGVVGVKGQDTGSLRICGPGSVLTYDTSEYFVQKSLDSGRAYIPVINAANANNTSVSVADNAASTAVKVQLILGLLAHNLT